jgi:hypothetical protein
MTAKAAPHGVSAQPSRARDRPRPDRCQAMGGARALKSVACDAVRSNSAAASSRNRPKTAGSGNDGISAGTNAPARWISVQIGQQSSARSCRPVGLEGALRSSADGCAPASALAPAEAGATCSRCTWPDTASWNASANSARYEPNLERDRNQLIVVTLRPSQTRQSHSAGPFHNFSWNVKLRQSGPSTIHLTCCQKTSVVRTRPCRGQGLPGIQCKIKAQRMAGLWIDVCSRSDWRDDLEGDVFVQLRWLFVSIGSVSG